MTVHQRMPGVWSLALIVGLLGATAATAQSPSPLGVPAVSPAGASVQASPPEPPGETTPLPARVVRGSCGAPGEVAYDLLAVIASGAPDGQNDTVYASISQLELAFTDIADQDMVLMVGGSDVDGAVACGSLRHQPQGPADLAISLAAKNRSAYSGTALLHGTEGGTAVYLVVVAAPESAGPEASPATATPLPEGSGLDPTRSVEPGTSGAPPFSPLPAGSSAP